MHKESYQTTSTPYTGDAFFRVEQTVTQHRGQQFVRHVVRHPGGVAVVAVQDGLALCIEQYRPAIDRVTIEVPAGRPRPFETAPDTGARELLEETGIVAGALVPLTRFYNAPCFCDGETQVFMADIGHSSSKVDVRGELPTFIKRVDLLEVEALVSSGYLVDAKTIISLLMARAHLASTPRVEG